MSNEQLPIKIIKGTSQLPSEHIVIHVSPLIETTNHIVYIRKNTLYDKYSRLDTSYKIMILCGILFAIVSFGVFIFLLYFISEIIIACTR